MKEIIAVINQKGGVGKSTTANALGAGLHRKGYRVLYIDLDAQSNLSYSLNAMRTYPTTLEVLMKTIAASDAIIETKQGDIIPAGTGLAGADLMITDTGKEYRLKEALEPLTDKYDYVIIDTPPALGTLTVNALTACTGIIIPAQADIYSLQGIGQLMQTIKTVKRYCNPDLQIKGILLTRYNSRTILTKNMTELLQDTATNLGTVIYNTQIRECIAVKESQVRQCDIFNYDTTSNAYKDYEAFINEFLEQSK